MDETLLSQLIQRLQTIGQEWQTVDAKQQLSLKESGSKAEFIKDVGAMANNGEPSYLVIGLVDGSFAAIGKLVSHYNKNDINQILSGRIDLS